MKVKLLAHSQLTVDFTDSLGDAYETYMSGKATDGQAIALSAVRTCYSANKPSEIVAKEGGKYFGNKATDGGKGTEADRLMRHIIASKHTSTLEHITFTFAIEGVSRALLTQLTRHRVGFSFSVQSQRYVKFSSYSKSGGFDYVIPEKVKTKGLTEEYEIAMGKIQGMYDELIELGIPQEDARSILPNAATTNLVMTVNLRSLLDFYAKRRAGNGAQAEIAELAGHLRKEVVKVEPWVDEFFEGGK
ncbi:TPA: FAD-dependent thymidylate synthase [Bacillus cereus]|uniref:FAD-dependent thymidylate synthase n=1 Tax=Bacillus sp. FSL M8-0139 TaxID=2921613 RepID=UPI0030F9A579|nr:FAD-dependent thymidylate synthase [Bacillus cereus]